MLDRDDTDRSALKFDIALLLEELESSVVRDRARTLRPCVMPALRLAFCLVVADALSQSALSDADRSERLQAWCAGLGVEVDDVRDVAAREWIDLELHHS